MVNATQGALGSETASQPLALAPTRPRHEPVLTGSPHLSLHAPPGQDWKNPEADRVDTGLRSASVSDALLDSSA